MPPLRIEMQLAGISVEPTLFPLDEPMAPPVVEVRGDCLEWRLDDPATGDQRWSLVKPDGALERFIAIEDGDADSVLRFARRYGVLLICEHQLPAFHNPGPLDQWHEPRRHGCRPLGWPKRGSTKPVVGYEPLLLWYQFAGIARSILRITAALNRGSMPHHDLWGTSGPKWPEEWRDMAMPIEVARRSLAERVNRWLLLGGVRPEVTWSAQTPKIRMGGGAIFGALGMQLAAALARVEGIAECDGCSQPYFRKVRKPQEGRRNFCGRSACAKKANRLAALEHATSMLRWSLHDKMIVAEHEARIRAIEMAEAAIAQARAG